MMGCNGTEMCLLVNALFTGLQFNRALTHFFGCINCRYGGFILSVAHTQD